MKTKKTNDLTKIYTPSYKSRFYAMLYALGIFSLLYSLTNLFAHHSNQQKALSNVAAFFHINIPFVDWAILPYSCSLLLFISSFFLVKTQKQLQRLTHRLLLATLIATLLFYWLPLTFDTLNFNAKAMLTAYNSQWAWAYNLLHFFDKPYNQLPSLHVIYALLLAITLWQTVKTQLGNIGVLLLVGLSISIALSTIFTWQHHLLDVVAGVFVAIIIWMLDQHLEYKHSKATKSSIIKYLVIAVSGFLLIQIAPVLIWKKYAILNVLGYYWFLSFVALTAAYYYQIPLVFNKVNGNHTRLTLFVFIPIILIYKIMWLVANKMHLIQIPHQKKPISIKLSTSDNPAYFNQKIDIIATGKPSNTALKQLLPLFTQYKQLIWVDIGCEISTNFDIVDDLLAEHTFACQYLNAPMLDVTSWDLTECETIKQYCQQLNNINQNLTADNSKTLIVCQCVMGWSRSVLMLTCVLAYFGMDNKQIANHIAKQYQQAHLKKLLDHQLLQRLSLIKE